ncbi:MAG TPA: hypothetical protein PLG84_02765 [Anaerolineaceae bacterium]|nr:hypothetical protein [Anaerolineaceae bacterium]HOE34196.1 hypothetical protein [Anaerolineaceae bacterium]HOT25193.1 hypothetical protein [Anaerolineaceae bacterium]HQH57748.1 hypothetical protein [Anaerolineaceae bacterium]HQK02746.1 hypothetical protein [Anaerolineaceae bacterium]
MLSAGCSGEISDILNQAKDVISSIKVTNSGNSAPSKVSSADYYCGLTTGYRAERVVLYAIHPLYPTNKGNVGAELLAVKAFQKDGYWWVYVNIADCNHIEDWQ